MSPEHFCFREKTSDFHQPLNTLHFFLNRRNESTDCQLKKNHAAAPNVRDNLNENSADLNQTESNEIFSKKKEASIIIKTVLV